MKKLLIIFAVLISQTVKAELPQISFLHSLKNYKEKETAVVTAVLSAPTMVEVSVVVVPQYQTDQADEMDHTMGASAKIVIAPGETQGSFSFFLPDDGMSETSESLTLKMTAPQNAVLGTSSMTIIITDHSEIMLPTVNFVSPEFNVLEGGTIELKVTLSGPALSIVIVPISVSGTATHYVDHNMHYQDEFIFYPGMTEATLTVSTFEDFTVEGQENIFIRMISPIVNARMGEIRETNILIEDSSFLD